MANLVTSIEHNPVFLLPERAIDLEIKNLAAYEPAGSLTPSTIVHNSTAPFQVSLEMEFGGNAFTTGFWLNFLQFSIDYFFESVGPGAEVGQPPSSAVVTTSGTWTGGPIYNYSHPVTTANVPVGLLTPNRVYRVGAIVRVWFAADPNRTHLLTGFVEGLILQTR